MTKPPRPISPKLPLATPPVKPENAPSQKPAVDAKALARELSSASDYCEISSKAGQEVVLCGSSAAKVAHGAGRFGAHAVPTAPLKRAKEGKIAGLAVVFMPGGYDYMASGQVPDMRVLELQPKYQATYGRFVVVKAADYQKKRASYDTIGTPVSISPDALAAPETTAPPPATNFTSALKHALTGEQFAQFVTRSTVDLGEGDPAKLTVTLVVANDTSPADLADLKRNLQAMARKMIKDAKLKNVLLSINVREE